MTASYAVRRVQEHHPHLDADYIRWRMWYSTYVSLERKYLYYQVPKSACTSMKMLIHTLEKLPPIRPFVGSQIEVRRDMFIHERNEFKLKSLVDFDDKTQEYILTSPDFLRLTVVRNPYTRLQSAWKDKALTCVPGYQYFYHQIKGRLPQGSDPQSFITFPAFVDVIAKDDLKVCDSHWRLQVEHFFHRSMNFNHIGRTEALSKTVELFIEQTGFPATQVPFAANTSIPNVAYDEILADRVYTLYEQDFVTLGYARDSWKSQDATAKFTPDTVSVSNFLDEIIERNIVIGHLYDERSNLRERVRQLESKAEPSVDTYPTTSFGDLFAQYISQIDGWLSKEEAEYLYQLAKSIVDGCIVEVGSYRGRSTAALAFGTNAGARAPIYAVEPHEKFRGVFGGEFGPNDRGSFMRTMVETGLYQNVRLVNLSSEFLSENWPMPVAMLYIDGDHRYEAVRRDFECWRGKLVANPVIVFFDASNPSSGPGKLAREIADGRIFNVEAGVGKLLCIRK